MYSINNYESNAITHLRAFAIVLILACHFLQGLGNSLAFALNVGVQIFLVISGYLYGRRHIVFAPWFRKRVITVYVPYSLFLIFVSPCYLMFHPEEIRVSYMLAHIVNIQEYWGGNRSLSSVVYDSYMDMLYFNPAASGYKGTRSK